MNRHATIIATALCTMLLPGPGAGASAPRGGTLIIFLGADDAYPTADLRALLDDYRALGEELDVDLQLRALDGGAPAQIVITPLVVFQNHRGRSIYQGRYDTLNRVRNFVRTSRVIPQSKQRLDRRDTLLWSEGRALVCAPVKVTALAGTLPDDLDEARFEAESHAAIAAGMERFELRRSFDLGRGDRSFYLDVHPYFDGGLLFLSCEIYSQFNCHTPIYSALDEPIIGFWEDRAALFGDAGRLFEQEIVRLMSAAPSRDAFTPVPGELPVVTWSKLGLDLPAPPLVAAAGAAPDLSVPTKWVVDDTRPASVFFRFAPPLEGYAGEAQTLTGELDLGERTLSDARATFRVPVSSITMGEELLDKDLQTQKFLHAEAHHMSSFTLTSMASNQDHLHFGEQTVATMSGLFRMKGHSIPIDVRTAFEPVLDDNAEPLLQMTADWSIRIGDPFGMIGPDGPMPARDTVQFTCHITLRPAGRDPEKQP